MPKAGRLGDSCSGHGCFPATPIIAGSPDVSINGKPAARKGDAVLLHACPCPNVPHGVHGRSISAGSSSVSINGKPASRVGDAIGCGGSIAAGSGDVFIGDTPYKGETFDCGKDSAQEKSTFLKITPLAEAADAIWTCPPFIDEPIRKVVKGEEQAVEVGQVSATRTEAANDLNALVEKDAQELISKNKTSGVAVSRAGIPEEGIISEPFENIPFSLKKGRTFPGTERCGDNKELIKITNQREYMDELSALYAKSGNRLNPVMESKIKEHVKEGAIFGLRDDKGLKGIPGLHAEVQAANNVLNKASAKPGFDVSKVQVSTFKTQNSFGQGKEFIACNHCSGILNGFDILTGH